MDSFRTVALKQDTTLIEGRLRHDDEGEDDICTVELAFDNRMIIGRAEDLFEALIHVRPELKKERIFLLINGASKDVWPSPMARSMGSGQRAYKMSIGKPALTSDLVDIFDTTPDIQPCTIAEQEGFRDQWIATLPG